MAAFISRLVSNFDRRWIAVLFVGKPPRALAADALRHIEVEAILLTGFSGRSGIKGW